MSNAEKMISEDLIRAILGNAAQGYFSKDHGDQLRKILDKPAQQHQGEPVGTLLIDEYFDNREVGDVDVQLDPKVCGQLAEKYPGQSISLYTHADPAEVERLSAELAERDALLREVLVGIWPSTPLAIKINAALSANAEPSAPVEIDERASTSNFCSPGNPCFFPVSCGCQSKK